MLPLVIDSAISANLVSGLLSWALVQSRIFYSQLSTPEELQDIATIRSFLDGMQLKRDVTTHMWFSELPKSIQSAFSNIANSEATMKSFGRLFSKPSYSVRIVESMNEIYVAALDTTKATSDNVFYSDHIDGPFMFFPFCSVFRSIVAINSNEQIKTIFPALPGGSCLTDGQVVSFDFNREIHRIERVADIPGQQPRRYTLKVHYLVYPTAFPLYGSFLAWATSAYDTLARLAFLKTLEPKGIIDQLLWLVIMGCTHLWFNSVW